MLRVFVKEIIFSLIEKIGSIENSYGSLSQFDEKQPVGLISFKFSEDAMIYNRIDVQKINPHNHLTKFHEKKIVLYKIMLKRRTK